MSRVDYSKWDHIELSDDEDIECHPNVDKKSFIRWRQQQIHEERAQRKHGIEQYTKQLDWLDKYLAILQHFPDPDKDTIDQAHKLLSEFQGVPENLQFTRVPNNPQAFSAFREHVMNHRLTIVKERERLVEESNRKLGVEDLCKPGFESTRISSSTTSPSIVKTPNPSPSFTTDSNKKKEEVIHVLNPAGVEMGRVKQAQEAAKKTHGPEDDYIDSDDALTFANWPITDYEGMYKYLRDHPHLVSSTISDQILAAAFQAGMDQRKNKVNQYVHQAQVIQFCVNLGPQGAPMFFSKITNTNHQATQLFKADLERTLAHIEKRCRVLKAKQKGELKSGINIEPGEPRMSVFRDLPSDLQQALISEDINAVESILQTKSERERESLRSRMINAGILLDPNVPQPSSPTELPAITDDFGNEISGEERLKLFKQLPTEFGNALIGGDLETAQKYLSNLPQDKQDEILQLCKQGGFLEFEEIDKEEEDHDETSIPNEIPPMDN